MMMSMKAPAELAQIFRGASRKLTPQRQLIFSLLYQNESHPTADSLFQLASKQMPGISKRTVYQTLGELAEMGELQTIDVGFGATRFDPKLSDHHHFVCQHCGLVRDVEISDKPRISSNNVGDCEIAEFGVVFRGRCSRCKKSKRSPGFQAKSNTN